METNYYSDEQRMRDEEYHHDWTGCLTAFVCVVLAIIGVGVLIIISKL